ncbi:MAG: 4Fe-4S binding protein [Chloroflexota bacterium]|nr:MAG: 4Fe-4S ferredoxin [Chloroflexota bacterium]
MEPTPWILPIIDLRRCTGCGKCEELCPTHAVAVQGGKATIVRPQDCSFCEICESYCPEGAIGRPFTISFAQPEAAAAG